MHAQVVAGNTSVPLTVQLKQKVAFGEVIKAVGNHPVLGDWDLGKGVALQWQEGNLWNATIDIPVGKPLKFKASADPQCQIHGGRLAWAEGFIAGALWYLAMQPDQGDGGEEVAWAKARRAPPFSRGGDGRGISHGQAQVPSSEASAWWWCGTLYAMHRACIIQERTEGSLPPDTGHRSE